jgi:hypothetical protein
MLTPHVHVVNDFISFHSFGGLELVHRYAHGGSNKSCHGGHVRVRNLGCNIWRRIMFPPHTPTFAPSVISTVDGVSKNTFLAWHVSVLGLVATWLSKVDLLREY